jgi:hypothetical protein
MEAITSTNYSKAQSQQIANMFRQVPRSSRFRQRSRFQWSLQRKVSYNRNTSDLFFYSVPALCKLFKLITLALTHNYSTRPTADVLGKSGVKVTVGKLVNTAH